MFLFYRLYCNVVILNITILNYTKGEEETLKNFGHEVKRIYIIYYENLNRQEI